ncbi:hypothetical protein B0H15DRAFT_954159 [Mycena belliarum]|uniref:Uncharacterized protein n=1 Tax=Mycena belliarum TaxID=1033014 RepID=A0AAD6TVG5_9AGAR|nr:hypothetical protein B0H15DRAFT_954159 [Mycena belliae]
MSDSPGTAAGPRGSADQSSGLEGLSSRAAGPLGSAATSDLRTYPLSSTAAGPSGSAVVAPSSDPRRYSTSRLPCDAGFDAHPGVIQGMRFELPLLQRYTGRDVEVDNVLYEIWSPNSTQIPFFPGRVRPGFALVPTAREQRRFDGHPGRFDHCEFPQYDVEDRDWAPFIRRASTIGPKESCRMGVHSLCVEWPKSSASPGGIKRSFFDSLSAWYGELGAQSEEALIEHQIQDEDWKRCPELPTQSNFEELRDCRVYEDAVDLLARMQRQMRERAAWIAMIRAMSTSVFDASDVVDQGLPVADEQYVGLFVNDAMSDKVAWLLSVGIPVFIAHRYARHEQPRSVERGTEVGARKSPLTNGFAYIAKREKFAVTEWEEDPGRMPDVLDGTHDRAFSSSLYLEARAKARADKPSCLRSPRENPW